jgi:hypothetical protein
MTPWHLWVVALLTLLWNGAGAITILMAQTGRLTDLDPHEVAYYANQPLWFVLTTCVATVAPVAAAVALLMRRRAAAWLFALALAAIVFNNIYDVAAGTSLTLVDQGWRNLTIALIIIALLQFAYAWAMKKRGALNR